MADAEEGQPQHHDIRTPPPSGMNPEGRERERLFDHLMNHQLAIELELDTTLGVPGEVQPPAFQG